MMIQVTSSSRANQALEFFRGWFASKRNQALAALVVYAAIAIVYFGLHVLPHLERECVCLPGGADPSIFMWSLVWWPHALLHGQNPFLTNAVFAPDGIDIGGGASIPGAALVVAPLTLLFGPIVSYNVVSLASPALAAFFAFLLFRYVTNNFAAGLVGGYVFGFSTYMLGQLLGHLHLVLVFPIPAAVHLSLRLIDRRITESRFIVLMALTLAALLLFSTEITLTFVLLGAVALALAFVFVPSARPGLIAVLKPTLTAGAVAALVTSPWIYYGLKGVQTLSPAVGDTYGGDSLGFLVPTSVVRLGRHYFAAVSASFTANASENGIYVGLPLALITARYAITRWRLPSTRLAVAMLAVVIVLTLGSHLHIAGHPTIPLPWKLIDHSLLRNVVPSRLSLYMSLIVALLAAMWLAQRRAGRLGIAKWAAAAVSVVFLLPNVGSGLWRWTPPNPSFFTTNEYRSVLRADETVLVLPFGGYGMSMLWQAETRMWFRMAGGYVNQRPSASYLSDPFLPALNGQVKPTPAQLRSFLVRRQVSAVILGPGALPVWQGTLAALGLKPRNLGGVMFYRL